MGWLRCIGQLLGAILLLGGYKNSLPFRAFGLGSCIGTGHLRPNAGGAWLAPITSNLPFQVLLSVQESVSSRLLYILVYIQSWMDN